MPNSVAERTVEVTNAFGLHIRPAGMAAKTAISFRSKISIIRGNDVTNARSIVALTTLGAGLGTRLTIRAEGPDADAAVKAIAALFENNFGEE
jgi:phosphocarrier protein HPr